MNQGESYRSSDARDAQSVHAKPVRVRNVRLRAADAEPAHVPQALLDWLVSTGGQDREAGALSPEFVGKVVDKLGTRSASP